MDFTDGSEDAVVKILATASDRTSGSDELARAIVDWPTRYHFARRRANIIRPFRLGPGIRVLDVGAGTGAIARAVGESGAEVVALEGSSARARAATMRCEGLDNVQVVCGNADDYSTERRFDLVMLIGVLEYAKRFSSGPTELLARLGSFLEDDGVLVVA